MPPATYKATGVPEPSKGTGVLRHGNALAITRPGEKHARILEQQVLALELMRSFKELRDPSELPIPASTKRTAEVKMARLLIDQMSTEEWDPAAHPNEYRRALERLLSGKRTFPVAQDARAEGGGKVVDLMEALRKSVAGSSGSATRSAGRKRTAAQAPPRRTSKKTGPKIVGAASARRATAR